MIVKDIVALFKETVSEWVKDKAPRLGAALAYYTVFSIAPLLIIVIGISSLVFGQDAAQGHIVDQIRDTVGDSAAKAIEDLIKHTYAAGQGIIATVIGLATLFFGALGLFVELQDALNTIWKVEPKPGRGWKGILHDRLLSFWMVAAVGFLLLISLAISAGLEVLGKLFSPDALPGGVYLWQGVNIIVSLGFFMALFAMMYKILPDVKIRWKDVWVGAAVTAVLFTVGKYLIGLYLGRAGPTSPFGAAGSLVLVLLWVYYSSQIFLFGAEFTRVYAEKYGRHVVPEDNAIPLTAEACARQGMKPGTEAKAGSPGPGG